MNRYVILSPASFLAATLMVAGGCEDDGEVSVTVRELSADRMSLAPGELVTLTWAIQTRAHIGGATGVALFHGMQDDEGSFAEDSDLVGVFGQERGTFACFYGLERQLSCASDEDDEIAGHEVLLPAGPTSLTLRVCTIGVDRSAEARLVRACDDQVLTLTLF